MTFSVIPLCCSVYPVLAAVAIVGKLISKVIQIKNPKTRYVITGRKWLDYILPGILPDRWMDKLFAKFLGIDKEKI